MTNETLDEDALVAAVELIGRMGATQFDFGHTEAPVTWWAKAQWGGQVASKDGYPDPLSVIEALARSLFNDAGRCTHCLRVASLSAGDGLCHYERHGDRYVRGCEAQYPADRPKSTKRRLAEALIHRGAPTQMLNNALDGLYDDYESPHPEMNIQLLVEHARHAGMADIAEMAIAGEFDGTKEESDAWAASPEGQALMAELGPMAKEFFDQKIKPHNGKPSANRAARRRKDRARKKHR